MSAQREPLIDGVYEFYDTTNTFFSPDFTCGLPFDSLCLANHFEEYTFARFAFAIAF